MVRKKVLESRGLPSDLNEDSSLQVDRSEQQWVDFLDEGVVPVRDGRYEPLVAVYPRAARAEAAARLARGELALQAFMHAGLAAGWLRSRPVTAVEEPLFANWNRPEDVGATPAQFLR